MSRKPFVAGNWKMNKLRKEAEQLSRGVLQGTSQVSSKVDVAIAPSATWLTIIDDVVRGSHVKLAAQNMHWSENGAFTGESSPTQLMDAGCSHIIIGHSERRQFFGETDEMVNSKVRAAIAYGLSPIICVGESLAERQASETKRKVEFQVRAALAGVNYDDAASITIAYEPIWAIGTGLTASPEQAQEVHASIRSLLFGLFGSDTSDAIRIQYGGSVKPANIDELIAQKDIDGALVGGASLSAESFVKIVKACAE